MEDISSLVKDYRTRKGLNVWGLSQRCGVAHKTIKNVEDGTDISYGNLKNIIDVIGYKMVFSNGNEKIRDMDFPTFLRRTRIKKGLTQGELADKCGILKQSIYCYEKGISGCSWYNLNDICEALGYEVGFVKEAKI